MESIKIEMEKQDVCPVCGCEHVYPVLDAHYRSVGLTYFACHKCKAHFLGNRIANNAQYYSEYYRMVVHGQRTPPDSEIEYQKKRAEHVVSASFSKDTWLAYEKDVMKVVDIGSSLGYLLHEIEKTAIELRKETGVDIKIEYYAVEMDAEYLKWGFENNIYPPDVHIVDDLSQLDGVIFDLIYLMHVLEHQNEPKKFLEGVITHMDDESALLLEVPYRVYNRFAYILHHPIAFDVVSLLLLMYSVRLKPFIYLTHSNPNGNKDFPLYLFAGGAKSED